MDRRKIDNNFNGKRGPKEAKIYEKHLETLEAPLKKINNKAPNLAVASYYNDARLSSETNRLSQIELENRLMLKIINEVYRTKGKLHITEPNAALSTNHFERLDKNKWLDRINKKFYEHLTKVKPTISMAAFEREYKRALETILFQARYMDYYASLIPELKRWDICPSEAEGKKRCNVKRRVMCYLDVAIDDPRTSPHKLIRLGRLHLELYRDFAPMAAANFLRFLNGHKGKCYKGTQFFRIQNNIGCVGGDVESDDGGGYYGIGGRCFSDENHLLKFNGPGVLSTFTLFPGHNHSHFFISFQRLEPLNGRFVVFGRVVKTLSALQRIEECGTKSGIPKQKVVIADCGIFGDVDLSEEDDNFFEYKLSLSSVAQVPGDKAEDVSADIESGK